jgi:hypothetical protein
VANASELRRIFLEPDVDSSLCSDVPAMQFDTDAARSYAVDELGLPAGPIDRELDRIRTAR